MLAAKFRDLAVGLAARPLAGADFNGKFFVLLGRLLSLRKRSVSFLYA
jgi:hypothetical protein